MTTVITSFGRMKKPVHSSLSEATELSQAVPGFDPHNSAWGCLSSPMPL